MNRPSDRGFTLIECLLAITIFSILMTSAYSVFRAGVRAERSGEALMEEMRSIRWVMDDLSREIRNAIPQPEGAFEGETDRLAFLTLLPSGEGADGRQLCQIRYALERDGMTELATLVKITSKPFLHDVDTLRVEAAIRDLAFSFERTDPTGERTWVTSWEGRKGMPSAIRIELTGPDASDPRRASVYAELVPILSEREIGLQRDGS